LRDENIQDSEGCLVVYDVENTKNSFGDVEDYVNRILKIKNVKNFPIFLIGAKCDSTDRKISTQEGIEKANKLHIPFFEVSSISGLNIQTVIHQLSQEIIQNKKKK
jgi:GTPase SAR1 family protein